MKETKQPWKVIKLSNGSKIVLPHAGYAPHLFRKAHNGGRKPKTDCGRLMTHKEHKACLNRNLKVLYRLDYDEHKAWFVTLKIDKQNASALSDFKSVNEKFIQLLTAVKRQYGKVLYVRGIEHKDNSFHVHSVFVFENKKPRMNGFKEKIKAHWTFGDVCIKSVTDRQGLALYFTKMKNRLIDYETGEVYVPVFPSGAHIIEKSRNFKRLTETVTYEPHERIIDELIEQKFVYTKKQHRFGSATCIDAIYMHPHQGQTNNEDN